MVHRPTTEKFNTASRGPKRANRVWKGKLPLGYLALQTTFANLFFDSMRKLLEKMKKMGKNGKTYLENSGSLWLLTVACNAATHAFVTK